MSKQGLVERFGLDPETARKLDELALQHSVYVLKDVALDLFTAFEKFMKFVSPVLYNAAKKAGRLMAQRLMEKGIVDRDNALKVLLYSLVRARYVEDAEVVEDKVEGKERRIVIRAKGCLFGSRLEREKPVDGFIAGFMAGWFETVYGCKAEAKEVECQACGDDNCVFEIRLRF